MSFWDMNTAEEQSDFRMIPGGTKSKMRLTFKVKGDGSNPEDWYEKSDKGAQMMEAQIELISGQYKGTKFREYCCIGGPTDGMATGAKITRSKFRAIIESARNINPKDSSPQAEQGRALTGPGDLMGAEFAAEIGFTKPNHKGGVFNEIRKVITPDKEEYEAIMGGQVIVGEEAPPQPPAQQQQGGSPQPQWGSQNNEGAQNPPAQQQGWGNQSNMPSGQNQGGNVPTWGQ